LDFRPQSLSKRKVRLARLLARVPAGIELNDHTDVDGAVVFRHVCVGLALQLLFLRASESMGNHDSKVVDADSVD
jgi:hypothetical protein